ALKMKIAALLARCKMRRRRSLGKTALGPTFRLRPSRTAIHSNDKAPLRIAARPACATQSRDCFQSVAESDSQVGSRLLDAGFRKHGEKSAPSGPITMNLCPRQHSG